MTPNPPVSFRNLKRFSWKGLRSARDLRLLCGILRTNLERLEELCLDFIDENVVRKIWEEKARWSVLDVEDQASDFFPGHVLPHEEAGSIQPLSSLNSLFLSACRIQGPTELLIPALNIEHLQSLKLHKCPGILDLFSAVVDSAIVLKLKYLEIISYDPPAPGDIISLETGLCQFLESFDGLEDMYIMIYPQELNIGCWEAIAHHKSTLKRLIWHETSEWYDLKVSWRNSRGLFELLGDMQLEWFGVSDYPGGVVRLRRLHD